MKAEIRQLYGLYISIVYNSNSGVDSSSILQMIYWDWIYRQRLDNDTVYILVYYVIVY